MSTEKPGKNAKGNTEERGFMKRAATFGASRITPESERKRRRENILHSVRGAREALRPAPLDRTDALNGWTGRHADGGRAAFAEAVAKEGLSHADLASRQRDHGILAIIFLMAAIFFTIIAVTQMIATGFALALMSLASIVAALLVAALALRHGYSRWQIARRRFGGLREFLLG